MIQQRCDITMVLLLACMVVLPAAYACPSATTGRRLLEAAPGKPIVAPNPSTGATSISIQLAFNERSNKMVDIQAAGAYAYYLHEADYSRSCTSQITTAPNGVKTAIIEPKPDTSRFNRSPWVPELLDTVQAGIQAKTVCDAPVLYSTSDEYFYSRLDVGVMTQGSPEIEFQKGSCMVALSVLNHHGTGCLCHCFEGRAVVGLESALAGADEGDNRAVLTCSGLHRDPALGCSCTLCPAVVA